MPRIKSLTPEQKARIPQIREEFFRYATSTVCPENKVVAERSALALAPGSKVHWVENPEKGQELFQELGGVSLAIVNSLYNSLYNSLVDSLVDSLRNSLANSLANSLVNSLRNSLVNSLDNSLVNSLDNSLVNYYWAGWACFRAFGGEVAQCYSAEDAAKLGLFIDLLKSTFAVWIVQDHIILCQKPSSFEIVDGKVRSFTFSETLMIEPPIVRRGWWTHIV